MKKIRMMILMLCIGGLLFACTSRNSEKQETEKNQVKEVSVIQAQNTLSQAEIEDGWVLLFDGKTSTGWRSYNKKSFPDKGWQIENGTLQVLSSGKGEAGGGGDIITSKMYQNFELSLEWKVSEGGNSGIFYLAREKAGQPIWKSAPEMQILDNAKHPDAKLGENGNRAAGSLYDLIPGDFEAVKPTGEWNQVKVMVYKGTVVHWVNGKSVLEYHLWTDDWNKMVLNSKFKDYEGFLNTAEEGYIGLQDHGDDVWFRNIKIKEL